MELSKFREIETVLQRNADQIKKMDLIKEELCTFMDNNPKGPVLKKINEISDFVQKSSEDLEQIKQLQIDDADELRISPQLVVIGLNTEKIFDIIKKFTIRPPKINYSKDKYILIESSIRTGVSSHE